MDAPVVACGGRHGVCKDDGYRSGGRRHALNSFGGLCGFVVACRGLLLQLHHWLHFLYSGLMCLCVFVCCWLRRWIWCSASATVGRCIGVIFWRGRMALSLSSLSPLMSWELPLCLTLFSLRCCCRGEGGGRRGLATGRTISPIVFCDFGVN